MLWFKDRRRSAAKNAGTLIVRRGFDAAYYYFLNFYARANGLTVVVDRRHQERRAAEPVTTHERRAGDRRRSPPETWEQGDCVVIPLPQSSDPPTERLEPNRTSLRERLISAITNSDRRPDLRDHDGRHDGGRRGAHDHGDEGDGKKNDD